MPQRPSKAILAAVAATLLTPLVTYAQQQQSPPQQRQIPRVATTPAVAIKVFGPGPYRYTPKNSKLIQKTLPPTKRSPELSVARQQLFPTGPTAIHAKLTPTAPLIAGKAGMNVFDSGLFTTTPSWGPPQILVHSEGGVSVDLRAMADKTYLFSVDVQSAGGGDCKFRVEQGPANFVEFPCKSDGPQTLIFAFKSGPTVDQDVGYFFAITSYKDFYLYSIQIDTQ